jgi:hypothetical protein
MTTNPQLAAVINQARQYIETAKATAADGLTVSEFGFLVVGLLRLVVAGVDSVPLDGAAKKQYVLDCVDLLFEAVADKLVPALMWPFWLVARSNVKAIVLAAAAGAVEQILPLVRQLA